MRARLDQRDSAGEKGGRKYAHRLKHAPVVLVRDAIPQRHVDRVVPALAVSDILEVARSREELAVLVERGGHDAVGGVERFFDSVAMVDVDVDVEDARVVAEEFEDAEDDVFEN